MKNIVNINSSPTSSQLFLHHQKQFKEIAETMSASGSQGSQGDFELASTSASNSISALNPHADFLENMKQMMTLGQQQLVSMQQQQLTTQQQVQSTQRSVQELASGLKREVKKFNVKLDNVESKVEDVTDRVEDISARLDSIMNNRFNNVTTEGKQIFPLLPFLFNGARGVCGWVPVDFTDDAGVEHSIVVISVRMTEFIITEMPSKSHLKNSVANLLRSFTRYNNGARPSMNEFIRIMTRTPFKCYVLGKNGRTFTFKNNDENYILVEADYWKGQMKEIVECFPDAVPNIPVPEKKIPMNVMTQRWSLVASSPSDLRTPVIPNLMGKRLTYEQRKYMPACGVPWWKEAYESGASKYFDMPIDDVEGEDLKHVVNGSYKSEGDWVRTFDETMERVQEYDEEEDDQSDDEEDEEAVVSSRKGKGKKQTKKRKRATEVEQLMNS